MGININLLSPTNNNVIDNSNVQLSANFNILHDENLSVGTLTNTVCNNEKLKLQTDNSITGDSKLSVIWGTHNKSHPGTTTAMDDIFNSITPQANTINTIIGWGLTSSNLKPSYLPTDYYAWKAYGYLYCPEDGIYTFSLDTDDCSDLFIDDALVVSEYNTGGSGCTNSWVITGTATLATGWHSFIVRMEEGTGGDSLGVAWKKPSDVALNYIQPSNFSTYVTYFPNGNRISNGILLSGIANNAIISWNENKPTGTNIIVKCAITTNSTQPDDSLYVIAVNGDIAPGIVNGYILDNKYYWIKIELSTTVGLTPDISKLKIDFPSLAKANLTFELDIVSSFNSPLKQTTTFTGISELITQNYDINSLKKGIYYWRVKAETLDNVYSEWSNLGNFEIKVGLTKRTYYNYFNLSKSTINVSKRVYYNYFNLSKTPLKIIKRVYHQYFEIIDFPPTPKILSLDKKQVNAGGTLTINGSGFGYVQNDDSVNLNRQLRGYGGNVYINNIACEVLSWSWEKIVVTLPMGLPLGTQNVNITLAKPDNYNSIPVGSRSSNYYPIYVISKTANYILTDNSGATDVVGEYIDYGKQSDWTGNLLLDEIEIASGCHTFYFDPIPGGGPVSIEFECVDELEPAYIDSVQIEPDLNTKWPSRYNEGPKSYQIDEFQSILDKIEATTYKKHATKHHIGGGDQISPELIGAETPAGVQTKIDALKQELYDYISQIQTGGVNGNTITFLPANNQTLLWSDKSGGPYTYDLSTYVPSTAKGAILKVIVESNGEGSASIIFSDELGNFGTISHFAQNGYTEYSGDWSGGQIFVPFLTGTKSVKWQMGSNSGVLDATPLSYGSIIGWY